MDPDTAAISFIDTKCTLQYSIQVSCILRQLRFVLTAAFPEILVLASSKRALTLLS